MQLANVVIANVGRRSRFILMETPIAIELPSVHFEYATAMDSRNCNMFQPFGIQVVP